MSVGPAVVSILVALYSDGTAPARQYAFAKPDDCRTAMALYNETLPKIKKVMRTQTQHRNTDTIEQIVGYACIDGVTEQVEYNLSNADR